MISLKIMRGTFLVRRCVKNKIGHIAIHTLMIPHEGKNQIKILTLI